jgi:hypothetical protein
MSIRLYVVSIFKRYKVKQSEDSQADIICKLLKECAKR